MWRDDLRPSKRIDRVLRGEVRLEDEDASIQSACSLYIYEGAVELLSIPTLDGRRRALSRVPEKIRPHIETEARRIHQMRRGR
jgi:hypothetical protein